MLAAGFATGLLMGCPVERANPEHCVHAGGDTYCAELHGGAHPYCVGGAGCEGLGANNGCVAELPSDDCHAPCGSDECNDTETFGADDATEAETGTTETETETGTDKETGPECVEDGDCSDAAAPFCGPSGACVGCGDLEDGDAACEALDPNTPACDGETCVECTAANTSACPLDAPICEDGVCVPCTTHQQCPDQAGCELTAGSCLYPVVHVDGGTTLADAFDTLAGGDGTLVVYDGDHQGPLTLAEGQTVAVVADTLFVENFSNVPRLESADEPVFTVSMGAALYLDGVRVDAQLDTLRLQGHGHVTRSWVSSDVGAAASVEGGLLTTRNTTLGTDGEFSNTLWIVAGGQVDLLYTTVINRHGPGVIGCVPPLLGVSPVRNSLLGELSDQDPMLCADLSYDHNAVEDASQVSGDNTSIGAFQISWFAANWTLLMQAPATIGVAALWQPGDPTTDIDGDARELDGPGWAGADKL